MTNENDAHLQEVNQEIYKRNLELAIVNKTLSLLRKLYQISLLTLDPVSLSHKVSETVRVDLNMEVVGVFAYDEKTDTLTPYTFSKSERLHATLNKLGFMFRDYKITNTFKNNTLKHVVHDKVAEMTSNLEDVWGGVIDDGKLQSLKAESHIKTILLDPLLSQNRIIGVLFLGLNRSFDTLNDSEKESIKSLVDVVAVGLDKALIYQQLEKTNEQLKILDQARSEFITIASHQLRTPPATIKWYLASILGGDFGKPSPEIAEQLTKVQFTNNSLIDLVDDLLNASRIERGKMEFSFGPVDLQNLTQITVDQLLPQAIMKKLKLIFIKPMEPLPQITADKEKLRQVINNMIDNAIKYTQKGEVKVTISQTATDLVLKVTDTGKGVAPDQLSHIFEKFDRGKDSVRHATGLGLGLYVAKVVIEQHKGKIWVESPGEGTGSTFIFSLPIKNDLKNDVFDLTKTQEITK